MDASSMYRNVYLRCDRLRKYADANAFTVPGKAILCRKIATSLKTQHANQKLLLLGGDIGWNALLLCGFLPDARICLIEKSRVAIRYARTICSNARSRFVRGDVRRKEVRWEAFDAVVVAFFLHLLPDWREFLSGVCSKMRKGAVLAVATVAEEQWKHNTLGRYLPKNGLPVFVETNDILSIARGQWMKCVSSETVVRVDAISTAEIPVAFSRYSNSFLYRLGRTQLTALHRRLANISSNGLVSVRFDCQLMIFRKARG